MYPLLQPSLENLADQICKSSPLDHLTLSSDSPYTSQLLLNAIRDALKSCGNQLMPQALPLLTFHDQILSVPECEYFEASSSSSSLYTTDVRSAFIQIILSHP